VCVGAAAAYTFTETPRYQSRAQLFVAAQTDQSNAFQGSQFTTARVQSYVDILRSPRITQPVVDELNLPMSARDLAGELSAVAPTNTVLINMTVDDVDARRAQLIGRAVSSQFVKFIQSLEYGAADGSAPVKVSVSTPATLPTAPSSPKKAINLTAGLLVGLILAAAAAFLRDRLDSSIHTSDELTSRFGLPVLGEIPFDAKAVEGLSGLGDPSSHRRVEALRVLRTNLQFVDIDSPPRVIVVTSCLPGEGKSTTISSLAAVIAEAGRKVVLIEGDLRSPVLSRYMGITPNIGLAGVMLERISLNDALLPVDAASNMMLLCAGPPTPNPSELLDSARMQSVITDLAAQFDTVLIDAPPVLAVADAAVLAARAEATLVVCEVGRTRGPTLERGLAALSTVGAHVIGAVANKARFKSDELYGYGGYGVYGNGLAPAAKAPEALGSKAAPNSAEETTAVANSNA
jgi:capsular exopolysaccharide synthesis family protein